MSAIFGTCNLDERPADRSVLARMCEVLEHRGPDGEAVWCDAHVGLGHRLLVTTPESLAECQPVRHGAITLVAHARIDNREELLRACGYAGGEDVCTDSKLIALAYRKWGQRCVDHIIGAFSFVLWDERERILWGARDHLGINQLYYALLPGRTFAFASEIKALFCVPGVEEHVDEVRIAEHLTREIVDPERTVFRGIRRALPGHTFTISESELRTRQYWRAEPSQSNASLSDEQVTERFLELFTEAVRCRVRSVYPIGAELSGGLDSSFVTCVAHDLLQEEEKTLRTVSLVYNEVPESDEREYIDAVLESRPALQPHYASPEQPGNGPLSLLDEIYDVLDDGRVAGNHHLNWLTLRTAAHEAGVRVLLTGQDGDTTVSHGWQYFAELASAGDWDTFATEAQAAVSHLRDEQRAYATQEFFTRPEQFLWAYGDYELKRMAVRGQYRRFVVAAHAIARHFDVSVTAIFRKYWRDLVQSAKGIQTQRRQRRGIQLPDVIRPDFASKCDIANRLAQHRKENGPVRSVREAQARTLNSPQLQSSLEKITNYAAAHGIEARHPFMDLRLVQFCLSLSPRQSLRHGWTRFVMRQAMKGVVPDSIRWRAGKTSLSNQFAYTLLHNDSAHVRASVEDLSSIEHICNAAYLEELWSGREEMSGEGLATLAMALGLNHWLHRRSVAHMQPRASMISENACGTRGRRRRIPVSL